MYGRRISVLLDNSKSAENNDNSVLSRRYRYLNQKLEHFWRRWKSEYLTDLREFHRNISQGHRTAKVGDVVLVQEDNTKRLLWKMGLVERLISGKDGTVRGAEIRVITKGKPYKLCRPVQKLYPLEVSVDDMEASEKREVSKDETREKENGEKRLDGEEVRRRPQRSAALDARWRNRILLDSKESRRGDVSGNLLCT